MTREEKLKMLLHPEQYTDKQIDQMLNGTEANTPDVNEEWRKFVEYKAVANSKFYTLRSKLIKIAAMFIGVLMLSGIAYAAVHLIRGQETGVGSQETTAVANSTLSTVNSQLAEQDSVLHQPIVFEDAELGTILSEVATFYKCETVYKNEKVKHVRLYFTWDKTARIDDIVETFNKFERFHITRENQKLIVE
ncbi:MAG: DUF4974 domain-containing protein [Prevotella sp.]|nr:DUF4974 domain-containing protein [Prevotella sp.]